MPTKDWTPRRPWPVGQIITRVRWMTAAEVRDFAWSGETGVVLETHDGGIIIASKDPEGNGPGVFFIAPPGKDVDILHPGTPPRT